MDLIFGLILIVSPFLLLTKFKNKRLGFSYILSFFIAFHLFVALITQTFKVFSYPIVLLINSALLLVVLVKSDLKILFRSLKQAILKRIDWVLVFVITVSFLNLYSVHYNYSGKYTTLRERDVQAEHMVYPYPYFSDEWYAASFIKDTIKTHSLPVKNPLLPWKPFFRNLELPFHSFLSEVTLLLGIDPVKDYTKLSIVFGTLTVLLIYLFLRLASLEKILAGIISLSTLYLTNGATLPGLWNLIPQNIGMIMMLLGMIFILTNRIWMMFLLGFLTLVFYPPFAVFYVTALTVYFLTKKSLAKKKKVQLVLISLLCVILAAIAVSSSYFFSQGNPGKFVNYIFSKLIHPSFILNAIPRYSIFHIIPLPILLLAPIGMITIFKKTPWLLSMTIIGIIYWMIYSFSTYRVVIEYERVIFATSILLTIVSGFGLQWLMNFLKSSAIFQENKILYYIEIGVLLLLLLLVPGYTKRDKWEKLTLYNFKTKQTLFPEAPANMHLHPDDLRIFKNTNDSVFLSFPWKGTVISVATNNYPLITKAGTISIKRWSLSSFMNADCAEKTRLAIKRNLDFAYVPEINCPNFQFIDKSSEGLSLYRFTEEI